MFGNTIVGNIVTVKINKKVATCVEVRLPLYRKHDLDSDYVSATTYEKIVLGDKGAMICYSVCITRDSEIELEVERNYRFHADSEISYTLGQGEYASSEAEFNDALQQTQQFLEEFK